MTSDRKNNQLAARERVAKLRREQARRDRRRRLLMYGTGAVLLLAVAGGTTAAVFARRAARPSLAAVKTYPVVQGHVEGRVAYKQNPPAGGPHNAVWLNCGIYNKPVPNENAVHDLEHGAVWITYRPDLPAGQVKDLTALVRGQTYLTLSPYPGLPAPVVASAWGKQLVLTGAADKRLPAFIQRYKQGPQAPEPGAVCTGGIGTPSS